MSRLELPPEHSEPFNKLVDTITSVTGSSRLFFAIDTARHAYPKEPDTIRRMGGNTFTQAHAQGRHADGRVMAGHSLEPDNIHRSVFSYLFNERARQQYGRIAELAVSCFLEAPTTKSLRVDLYWLEQDGTAWTRTEEQFGESRLAAEQQKRAARRRLKDFELGTVEKILQGTVPS